MNVTDVMHKDHLKAMDLAERLYGKAEAPNCDQTQSLVNELVEAVTLHAKSEEAAVYEMCRRYGKDLKEFALDGFEEHHLIDEELEKISRTSPGDDGQLKAYVHVLKALLHHHAEVEEESELFPKLKSHFSEAQLDQMGDFMLREQERLKGSGLFKAAARAPLNLAASVAHPR